MHVGIQLGLTLSSIQISQNPKALILIIPPSGSHAHGFD